MPRRGDIRRALALVDKTVLLWGVVLLGLLGPAVSLAQAGVVDDAGNAVALAQPARRIVSLAPHATELLFAVGAGPQVVGVMAFSDYPPPARALPRVGGYAGLDLEAIVALRPDLVVAWSSGNPAAHIDRLRALGMAVFVSEPRRLDDIPRTLDRLGALTGHRDEARRAAAAFRARLAALAQRHRERPKVRVFYQVWDRPLVTLNGEHLVNHLIELCGGRNVFAALPVLAPHVGVEAVIAAAPQAIVASGTAAAASRWLFAWRRWDTLPAVAAGNLFMIHPDLGLRPTPRILEGAQALCGALEQARRSLALN
ncbi:MAG: cobalamin-binding protein [Pseudomonadota bacterium]|nr:cobalamin-binding protein [Pseudomonadota bacterium]